MTEKQLLKKIGVRIKQIRTEKGLSQSDLAYEVPMEKANISRLESGQFNTKIITLYNVAKALDMDLSDLLKLDK